MGKTRKQKERRKLAPWIVGVFVAAVGAVAAVVTRRKKNWADDERRPSALPNEHHLKESAMSLADKAKNTADKAAGKVKEATGKATDNEKLEAEGKAQNAEGHVKQAGENVKDAFKK